MKITIISILICAALLAVSTNCENLAHMYFDNVPEEGTVYYFGSSRAESNLNGLDKFNSKGSCCCSSGQGSCTFSTSTTNCVTTSGTCKCGPC